MSTSQPTTTPLPLEIGKRYRTIVTTIALLVSLPLASIQIYNFIQAPSSKLAVIVEAFPNVVPPQLHSDDATQFAIGDKIPVNSLGPDLMQMNTQLVVTLTNSGDLPFEDMKLIHPRHKLVGVEEKDWFQITKADPNPYPLGKLEVEERKRIFVWSDQPWTENSELVIAYKGGKVRAKASNYFPTTWQVIQIVLAILVGTILLTATLAVVFRKAVAGWLADAFFASLLSGPPMSPEERARRVALLTSGEQSRISTPQQ